MRILLSILFAAAAAVACSGGFLPRNGDVVFRAGEGVAAEAISAATARRGDMPFSHAGIVMRSPEGLFVVEASGEHGTVITPYDEFLSAASSVEGRLVVAVGRVRCSRREADQAVRRALTFVGVPYDDEFLPHNGKLYCSELVREAFITSSGEYILGDLSMTFCDAEGHLPDYWRDHFAALAMPVPEGVRGTNPAAMSRDAAVEIVYTYY